MGRRIATTSHKEEDGGSQADRRAEPAHSATTQTTVRGRVMWVRTQATWTEAMQSDATRAGVTDVETGGLAAVGTGSLNAVETGTLSAVTRTLAQLRCVVSRTICAHTVLQRESRELRDLRLTSILNPPHLALAAACFCWLLLASTCFFWLLLPVLSPLAAAGRSVRSRHWPVGWSVSTHATSTGPGRNGPEKRVRSRRGSRSRRDRSKSRNRRRSRTE